MAKKAKKREPLSITLVGASRLGVGLCIALRRAGVGIERVWNRGAERRMVAGKLMPGVEVVGGSIAQALEGTRSVVLVSVVDDALAEVGAVIAGVPGLRTVIHTSGALTAAHLGLPKDVAAASLHPVVTATTQEQAAEQVVGANFALEGAPRAVGVCRELVELLGGSAFMIAPENKLRYHAAAVLASNALVALQHEAQSLAATVGIPSAAQLVFEPLARNALEGVMRLGPARALTGPVARGDAKVVKAHLDALSGQTREVYLVLSRSALELARIRGLSEEKLRALESVLR